VDVVPLGIAVVHSDEDPAGDLVRDVDDPNPGLLERGERPLLTGGDVDTVEEEVLVARPASLMNRICLLSGDQ
jgi:hypothetical protein